ncbi:hypothetical protein HDU83_005432 [Entophlyctis luteolus]|nr:hypothetical protein HDU83_005432 [Entophlyctis luteolus]KAJ3381594.1 hypothetical protein HDU84_004998 [Entophlyctis sp. JEL0112]
MEIHKPALEAEEEVTSATDGTINNSGVEVAVVVETESFVVIDTEFVEVMPSVASTVASGIEEDVDSVDPILDASWTLDDVELSLFMGKDRGANEACDSLRRASFMMKT